MNRTTILIALLAVLTLGANRGYDGASQLFQYYLLDTNGFEPNVFWENSNEETDLIPWNAAEPYKGLGFRNVEAEVAEARYEIEEFPITRRQ